MEFHERLRAMRLHANLTQKELGEQAGVSVMTVRNWESGAKQPSMQAVIALSAILRQSADTLLGLRQIQDAAQPVSRREAALLDRYRTLDTHGRKLVDTVCTLEYARVKDQTHAANTVRMIPRYTMPSAAGFSAPFDADDYDEIPLPADAPERTDFAVRIQGDSMEPRIPDGSLVFVRKTDTLRPGEIGIFSVNGTMYCKRYHPEPDGSLTLLSENPERQDCNVRIQPDSADTVVCLGKVLLDEAFRKDI